MPLNKLLTAQTPRSTTLHRWLWNYARWSTPEQDWGTSDERQTEMGRAWAIKQDFEFIDRYRDEGMSGYHGKNSKVGSLSQFLRDIGSLDPSRPMPRAGDAIGVDELSRLGRDEVLDAAYLVKQILDAGISIVIYRYDLEIDRERLRREPWLNDMIMSELNRSHNESYQKGLHVRAAKESARRRGRERGEQISGRACPGWLILTDDRKHYMTHLERGRIVRLIFKWADAGVSEGEIARRLNQMHVPTFAAIGRKRMGRIERTGWKPIWYPASVHQLLVNRAVIGWCQPKQIVDGKRVNIGEAIQLFPADVLVPGDEKASEAMFYRVKRRLSESAATGRGRKNKYKNIVAGLLVCGVCGGRVHIHSAPKSTTPSQGWQRGYLSCERATWDGCDSRASFPYGPFEEMLFRLSDTSSAHIVPEQPDNTAARRLADVDSIIAGRQEELAAQQHAYGALKSATAKSNALVEIDRLGGEIDELKQERDELFQRVKLDQHVVSRAFVERWQEARTQIESPDEEIRLDARRALMAEYRRIIDKLILYDDRPLSDREPGEFYPGDECDRVIGQTNIVIRMKRRGDSHFEYDLAVDHVIGARLIRHDVPDALRAYGVSGRSDIYYDRTGMCRVTDRTGETILVTPYPLEAYRETREYAQVDFYEHIAVPSPYLQRVNRSVEKIRQTIKTLKQEGRRVTKLAVAQVGHMSHTTVHKHWSKAIDA